MRDLMKGPYELSVWEDQLFFVTDEKDPSGGNKEYDSDSLSSAKGKVLYQYYKETKLMVIGSDTMDTPIRAFNPRLVSNVNGTSTLTFDMLYRYYNEEANEFYSNPIVKMLVNERKLKLRRGKQGSSDCKWYDLVIKDVQEDSEGEFFTYTAKDLFINELSKSGFNIELNPKLENNTGTIVQLGKTILEGSDWQIPENFSIDLKQTIEEPLYSVKLNKSITASTMLGKKKTTISSGKVIYGFYNSISNELPYFQFLYAENGKLPVDENSVATAQDNYFVDGTTYQNGKPSFASEVSLLEGIRGKRLVRKSAIKYDPVLDRYVNVYEDGNQKEVYGYSETEYISPTTVDNFVTNPTDFESLLGWSEGPIKKGEGVEYPYLNIKTLPDIFEDKYTSEEYNSFLTIKNTAPGQVVYNSGIQDNRSRIETFTKGEKYVFRVAYGVPDSAKKNIQGTNVGLKASVFTYTLTDGIYTPERKLFNFSISKGLGTSYADTTSVCLETISYSDLVSSKIGLFLEVGATDVEIYLKDVQFFPYVEDANKKMCVPGGEVQAIVKEKYYYYYPDKAIKDKNKIEYIYKGETPSPSYIPKFNDETNYEKVRSITAAESNRFNLIQTLAETFECWAKFTVDHNMSSGEILLEDIRDSSGNLAGKRQRKWVTFFESFLKENHIGFKYGINLRGVKRNLESEGIVSKIVVKNNSNEYAKDGFCSIARAAENPSGENAVYDFSYYVSQGLLNYNEVNNDLYMTTGGWLGYYKHLKKFNLDRDKKIEESAKLIEEESKLSAQLQTYTISVDKALEEKKAKEAEVQSLTGYTFHELINSNDEKAKVWQEDPEVKGLCSAVARLDNTIKRHSQLRDQAQKNLDANKTKQEEVQKALDDILAEKIRLDERFNAKYSRFIQEGSWISEDYVDDDLYYFDSVSTLHTSSQPKVSYVIDVLELSSLEGYENFIYELGEKTFVEDTDFFGWNFIDGVKTPYKEEIIVTEISVNLDDPSQNQIKVQNYKTQFEDLFQRIAATTQAVEYSTGKYEKVTTIIQPNGAIAQGTLQNSMLNNSLVIQNAKDQSVVWDNTGITTTSLSAPNEVLRIVSGGVFLSDDGGVTWHTGMTGKGINANYITTGQLDTSIIRVMNGNFPSFRWDKMGISAYQFSVNQKTGAAENFNFQNFIRYDQYGLYGIKGYANFDPTIPDKGSKEVGEEKIWKNANFALTWKGFSLKSSHTGAGELANAGYISITSDNDFQVINATGKEQVKIGYLGGTGETPIYGIRINDANGEPVLWSDNSGKLFLSSYLRIGPAAQESLLDRTRFGIVQTYDLSSEKPTVAKGTISKILAIKKNPEELLFPDPFSKNSEVQAAFQKVFDSTKEAIALYDDGTLVANQLVSNGLKARNAYIEGEIYATKGKIGNLTIGDVENSVNSSRGVEIQSQTGYVFKVDKNGNPTQQSIKLRAVAKGFDILNADALSWHGSSNFKDWTPLNRTGVYLDFTYEDMQKKQQKDTYFIKVIYKDNDQGTEYDSYCTLSILKDGLDGISPITVEVTSQQGNIFINNDIQAILTAHVYQENQDITKSFKASQFSWTKYNEDGTTDKEWTEQHQNYGNVIEVDHLSVDRKAKFTCDLVLN